jgi:LuxR family maltose regulon positive regulatory protein
LLPRTSAPLHLDSSASGQETLEYLEHANLFIVPLDEERRWYRYHHLFADLLRQQLRQTQPEQAPTLHHRASDWYEQKGFVDEAIEHALRGEYFERVAYLIEDQFGDNYGRGDQALLRRWLAELPEELVFSKPRLCILHAWNLFTYGQLDAADRSLQAAEKMLDPNTDQELVSSPDKDQLSDTNKMKLVGRVAAIRSFLASYSGDIPGTIRYARQALDYLPEQELPWRSAALITLGDAYANQGQMVAAYEARSDALVTGKASGDTYLLMIVNLRLAEILRQQGKLQQVIDICERQLKGADESGISESAVVGWLLGIWGEVLAELNNLDRAIDQAKKGVKLTARGGDVLHERIWLAQDKLDAASQWVGERGLDAGGEPTLLHEMEYIALARILIAQERLDEATGLLYRLLEAVEAGGRTSRAIEIVMLQALTYQAGGDMDQAMSTFERCLHLAEPGGFIRIFIDEGPPMARLVQEALNRGIALEYVHRLLAAFSSDEPTQADTWTHKADQSGLIEPLSERELEVIQHLAEGLTNREIADRLYLSLNTVKVHTRNIYGKLGVKNRTQAVTQARDLGLLDNLSA